MKKKGFKYLANIANGRLRILRVYASIFTYEKNVADDGQVYIILGSVRRSRISDYDKVLHLTFRNLG